MLFVVYNHLHAKQSCWSFFFYNPHLFIPTFQLLCISVTVGNMRNVTFYSGCAAQALRRVTEEQASAANLTVHDVLVRNVTLQSNPPHIYPKSKPVTLERYIFPIAFLNMLQMSSPTKALCYTLIRLHVPNAWYTLLCVKCILGRWCKPIAPQRYF